MASRLMPLLLCALIFAASNAAIITSATLCPTAILSSPDGKRFYIACGKANCILCCEPAIPRVSERLTVADSPSGLGISRNGRYLYVTCGGPESQVCVIDIQKWRIVESIPVGHTATAAVVAPDGNTLYVCNRFNNDISAIDLLSCKEIRRIAVEREPVAADITKDGRYLLVANHIHDGRADTKHVAAVVSVIDVAVGKVVKELQLPDGSGSLNDVRVSPDGKYAVVTHLIGRFKNLPTHVTEGWINTNALTIVDLGKLEICGTVLLDDSYEGAANPWGLAWSEDSNTVCVAHAGTGEVSVIDFKKLLSTLPALSRRSYAEADEADDLPFFPGNARLRVKLPSGDLGPRALAIVGHTVYTANYFSDTLSEIDLKGNQPRTKSIALGPKIEPDLVQKGDFYFHDASICFQGWQSCSSCHPGDARSDGLNWDLLNDGIGNPKTTKSLLLAEETPPSMWLGVRANAQEAVRAGIEHILFTIQPDDVAAAIDAYLKSLKPVPSPHLINGKLSPAAERGHTIFNSVGCAHCHPPLLFTDLRSHDVGTSSGVDAGKPFYTPTLVEAWRTAPYLHDGRAATLHDLFTPPAGQKAHGRTSSLSEREKDDLIEYILSL